MSSVTRRFRVIDGEVKEVTAQPSSKPSIGGVAAFTADKPWKSISCGCHSSEVTQMNDAMRNYGVVGAEFDQSGALTATSRRGRAKALEFLGAADKDGGYGDTNKHDLNGLRELYARPENHG